jgi:hypothetical protein
VTQPVTRYHSDPGDAFLRFCHVAYDYDCYECDCVFTIKTRASLLEIRVTLVMAGWLQHTDVKGRWTCPDCQKAKSNGFSVPHTSKESFWYGCS